MKDLVANKTLTAVKRATKAPCGLKGVSDTFDRHCQIAPEYTLHTSPSKQDDEREMIELVHRRRPFVFTLGCKHNSFSTIPKSALDQLDIVKLDAWLTRHKRKLAACRFAGADTDGDNSSGIEGESDNDLDEESDVEEISPD